MTQQSEVKNDPNYRLCLNAGFVGLVDHMGNDSSIVQAARVSYGKGTKKISEDRGLIRYLVRHSHTTPLEMVEFKFHCKMPIFVARQWVRHRTASINEYSGRYSEMSEDMFVPELETIKPQSTTNKQGRNGEFSEKEQKSIQLAIEDSNLASQYEYKELLKLNLSREMARGVLSVNNYTEWYWKTDLHNLFHYLKLRMDNHAQEEIRVYANAMYELIQPIVPLACESFDEYIFNLDLNTYQYYHISRTELILLRTFINRVKKEYPHWIELEIGLAKEVASFSQREIDEFKVKFDIQ